MKSGMDGEHCDSRGRVCAGKAACILPTPSCAGHRHLIVHVDS